MSLLDDAINFAIEAHKGQLDKAGEPYILHPLRIMLEMPDETHRITAVLHDVIEDCDEICLEDLDPFGNDVVAAVEALSRWDDETYTDYIKRVGMNPIARTVKISDLRDNLRQDRGEISASHLERYTRALHDLLGETE